MTLDRRSLLTGAGVAGLGIVLAGTTDALFTAAPALAHPGAGYGDPVPDPAGILDLPPGFRYTILSREDDPYAGGRVPGYFDGMGAFAGLGGQVRLTRNHENHPDARHPVVGPPERTFDPGGKGGVTVLALDRRHRRVGEYVGVAGTAVNCAGGVTPWHTWLTCEETELRRGDQGYEKDHGWIFEVDPFRDARNADPTPLTAMGRFPHEAICVDPRTGTVYETEDASGQAFGCFYRFLPRRPLGGHGSLRAGGRLQAMRVPGVADLSTVREPGTTIGGVEWMDVPDPSATTTPTRYQDYGPAGVTHSAKLEGAWWGVDGAAYFVSSYARPEEGAAAAHRGQVWRYEPATRCLTLVVIFHADGTDDPLFETPDNICVTPFGGLMICQDGDGENYLMGVTRAGRPYPFARNRQNTGSATEPVFGEFAGVCFADDRRTLYVNIQAPGTTFAVTGPFCR
ncbi:alkaline phosphatase PhoX [Micromonospora sp. NPDC018662]|uniref:alkaline phosphatase PhoX n=1 Tax=Micromonospora sp. NPDC018662 TaxID=3364238 RepID=UPI0037B5B460